eukprot:Platyproteum_vivax@DN5100_c0_g1_i1.p1
MSSIVPYNTLYIDSNLWQMANVIKSTATFTRSDTLEKQVCELWDKKYSHEWQIVASVRSGLDLVIQGLFTQGFVEYGSEVLMGSINIPEMSNILRAHGLVPIPIDMNIEDMTVRLDCLKRNYTKRAKVILVPQLFGKIADISELIEFARARNLFVIEDCAQAFVGKRFRGSKQADANLFSFGTIKSLTASGGGLLRLKNNNLLKITKNVQAKYAYQSSAKYYQKLVLTCYLLMCQPPVTCSQWMYYCRKFNYNYQAYFVNMTRGFQDGGDIFKKYRIRPCNVLMAALKYRIEHFDDAKYQQDMQRLYNFTLSLTEKGVEVPGLSSLHDSNYGFWLYPVLCPIGSNPKKIIDELTKCGVFAQVASTQLTVIQPPSTGNYEMPRRSAHFFERVIFLPVNRSVSQKWLNEIATRVEKTMRANTSLSSDVGLNLEPEAHLLPMMSKL